MNWNEKKDFVETEIRGKVITMSVDIEFSLLAIMMYCSPEPYNQQREFRNMMMGGKIKNTVADLKKYKNAYFVRYECELDKLEEFRIVRNDFAHHTLEFHEEGNLRKFRIRYIDLVEGKEHFHYKDYELDYLQDYVKRCRALNLVLAQLVEELREDFVKNHKT